MDRIAFSNSYQSALLGILNAQDRQNTAQQQYSTGKLASDLKGFAGSADQITAARALQARVNNYVDTNTALKDRLNVQDQSLSQVATVTQSARQAIAEALATGDATGLMTSLQGQLSQAASTLNTQYNGQYLFAGGTTGQAPVTAQNLSDLTAAPGVPGVFKNGNTPTQSRLDDQTRITTGFTASSVGTPLFNALKSVEAFSQGGSGPLSGKLTTAQTTFLQGMLSTFDSAYQSVNDQVAQNGLIQNQVDASQTSLKARQTALTTALGDLTNVDQAKAATDLQLAQTALQASAQVFTSLKTVSLLNTLSSGA